MVDLPALSDMSLQVLFPRHLDTTCRALHTQYHQCHEDLAMADLCFGNRGIPQRIRFNANGDIGGDFGGGRSS
jgi:hypothetical protein